MPCTFEERYVESIERDTTRSFLSVHTFAHPSGYGKEPSVKRERPSSDTFQQRDAVTVCRPYQCPLQCTILVESFPVSATTDNRLEGNGASSIVSRCHLAARMVTAQHTWTSQAFPTSLGVRTMILRRPHSKSFLHDMMPMDQVLNVDKSGTRDRVR